MSGKPPPKKDDLASKLQLANHLPRLALLSTLFVLGTLAVVLVWPAVSRAGRETATAGQVSNHHRLIENKCEACHAAPFQGAPDNQCTTCHKVNDHATAMPAMLKDHPEQQMHCASCHKEHHGLQSLVPTDSPLCTGCHWQISKLLPDTREPSIDSFAKHPEFALLTRVKTSPFAQAGSPKTKSASDWTPIKFSHVEHLAVHPGKEYPDALDCPSCHVPIADGSTMQPISYSKDCKRCHELKLDGRLTGLIVPHGSPDRALEAIRAELARAYVGLGIRVVHDAPPPSGLAALNAAAPPDGVVPGAPQPPEVPSQEKIAAEALDLEQGLYSDNGGCSKCHDVTTVPPEAGRSTHAVIPPKIPKVWMPASKYQHGPHRTVPCRKCHDAVERSTTASDVLIPGIARCRDCHGDPGAVGKVESPCLECHRYHAVK